MTKEQIKQQAREMAERCAAELHSEFSNEWFRGLSPELHSNHYAEYEALYENAKEERRKIAETILQELNLESLLEDKARLDWLDKHNGRIARLSDGWNAWKSGEKSTAVNFDVRLAITNAMQEKESGE